ncbi:hypothetical protein AB0C77_06250 [Streptomyces sp. NPDC048629]|uniref:hypothetical protein n=1 Tax=Streptomyces sp. NPDC048629 TaxID=3154824 RepID=UPI003428CD85
MWSLKNEDPEFMAYMEAFMASTQHLGGCSACQEEQPCGVGEPIHAEFIARQDAWMERRRAEGKKP